MQPYTRPSPSSKPQIQVLQAIELPHYPSKATIPFNLP